MDHKDLMNWPTCIFEQFQELQFSDLSGPLSISVMKKYISRICTFTIINHVFSIKSTNFVLLLEKEYYEIRRVIYYS